MESTVRPPAPRARAAARGPAARRPRAGGTVVGGAVLVATAAGGEAGPRPASRSATRRSLGRLLAQLADLGIRETEILTRPEWVPALTAAAEGHGIAVRVRGVDGTAGALRAVAELAGAGDGTLVVANADILTQREALAGLIADPRVPTGMLTTTVRRVYRYVGLRTRTRRGRVVSAGTPYHYVHGPNGTFLGVLKIAPAQRVALAEVAEQLAGLVDGDLPPGWQDELDHKADRWKLALHRRALRALVDPEQAEDSSDEAARGGVRGARSATRTTSRSAPTRPRSSTAGWPPPRATSPRCCSAGSSAPTSRSAARTCASCSGRAR